MNEMRSNFPIWIKWTHLGLAFFGITAYLTGELAEHSNSYGYLLHAYLGMTLLLFLANRFIYGFLGQNVYRFSNWFPYKMSYLITVKEDYFGTNCVRHQLKLLVSSIIFPINRFNTVLST